MVLSLVLAASVTTVGDAHAITPENDDRADAREIEELPYTDEENTLLATREADESSSSCRSSSEATVWYAYTPEEDELLVADTNGSDHDTTVVVYDESGQVDCGWDSRWSEDPAVIFEASAGVRYLFQVSSQRYIIPSGTQAQLVFNLDAPEPPSNDDRGEAVDIETLSYHDERGTLGATLEEGESRPCGEIGATVWYTYTPEEDETVFVDTRDSDYDFDTVVAVHDSNGHVVACNDDVKMDTHWYEKRAQLEFDAIAETRYLIQVGGFRGDTGSLGLAVRGPTGFSTETPPNDARAGATAIQDLPFEGSQATMNATTEPGEARPCGSIGSTVWFSFTPDEPRTVQADTYGSDYDTALAVYEQGSDEALACNDDADGTQAAVHVDLESGTTYEFQVGGFRGATGGLVFHLGQAPLPEPEPEFVAPEEAEIRPGVKLRIEGTGSCTSNFVFRGTGPQQGKLYLGTAGHCVDWEVGAAVRLTPELGYYTGNHGQVIGHVAYSSFKEEGIETFRCYAVLSCAESGIDFALIELNDEFEGRVSPSMLGYGGPTGLVPFEEVDVGDKALTYGNSPLRPGTGVLDPREGYVNDKEADASDGRRDEIYAYFAGPGVPGDSGSAVIGGDGRAMGTLVTMWFLPPGQNGITSLSRALEFASSHGWDVELATSDTFDPGLLPDLNG